MIFHDYGKGREEIAASNYNKQLQIGFYFVTEAWEKREDILRPPPSFSSKSEKTEK